jgi:hypothetical protein
MWGIENETVGCEPFWSRPVAETAIRTLEMAGGFRVRG